MAPTSYDSARGALGAHPDTFDSIRSGLVRLRRYHDIDDEVAQAFPRSAEVARAQLRLIDLLTEWIQPAVDEERAVWNALQEEAVGADLHVVES